MNKNILVFGASGLVGGYLLPRLGELGANIKAFGRNPFTNLSDNVTHINGDLNSIDIDAIQKLDFDTLIYMAQCRKFRNFPESSRSIFSVNTASVIDLLEICRKKGVSKFIYLSTGGVYAGGDEFIHEDSELVDSNTANFYIKSKVMAEMVLSEYAKYLDTVIFRPFFIYGRGQDRSMLIPRLYDRVLSDSEISLQGDNGIEIFPLHAADMADAILFSLGENVSGTYNIAGPNGLTIKSIAEMFAKDADKTPSFNLSQEPSLNYRVKSEKLYRQFQVKRRSLMSSLADVRP